MNRLCMSSEVHTAVLQSRDAIARPWQSGTYLQKCIYTRNWWASRVNFCRWYWNGIVLKSSSVGKLCCCRAGIISMKSHKYGETERERLPVLMRFDDSNIFRWNGYRWIPTVWLNRVINYVLQSRRAIYLVSRALNFWLKWNSNTEIFPDFPRARNNISHCSCN